MTEIITRKEAKERGLKRYFTGKPCRHGHISDRHTVNGQCNECCKLRYRRRWIEIKADPVKSAYRKARKNAAWAAMPEDHRKTALKKQAESRARRRMEAIQRGEIIPRPKLTNEQRKRNQCLRLKAWRQANRDRINKQQRERWKNDAEYRERMRKKARENYYRRIRQGQRNHINRVRRKSMSARLYTQKRAAGEALRDEITRSDILNILDRQNGRCILCDVFIGNEGEKFEIDHDVPLSRGGMHELDNIQLLCVRCNRSKGYKTTEEYIFLSC